MSVKKKLKLSRGGRRRVQRRRQPTRVYDALKVTSEEASSLVLVLSKQIAASFAVLQWVTSIFTPRI